MSRALNLYASKLEVVAICAKHSAEITSIQQLTSGGTRVMLRTGDAAAVVARAFKGKQIAGTITRSPLRTARAQ